MPESSFITVEISGHVATAWLDRDDDINALAPDFWREFPATISVLDADPEVRVIVVASRRRAFTVGIDLKAFGPMLAGATPDVSSRRDLYAKVKELQHTFTALDQCAKPVIVAVHGYCIGAGVDLITAADIRLAAADAVFSVRETKMGMVADVGTLQRLPRIVGPGHVAELVFTGRDVTANEALDMGLVDHVYPDRETLLERTSHLAAAIAANSPLAVQGSKQVLRAGEAMTTDAALDYVAVWNSSFLASNDLREAITAYLAKRDPEFDGT